MTPIEIATLLGKLMGQAALGRLVGRGTDAIIDWCKGESKEKFTTADADELRALLDDQSGPSFWSRFLSRKDKRGIALIGPSGAGKSLIWNFMTNGSVSTDLDAKAYTRVRKEAYASVHDRPVLIVDLPGSIRHEIFHQTFEYLQTNTPRIVVFVFAYGYLEAGGLDGLKIPGGTQLDTLQTYLDFTRSQEQHWVEFCLKELKLKKKSLDCLVAVNKMDLWYEDKVRVEEHYLSGDFGAKLKQLASVLSVVGTPTVHGVAADYNSFKLQQAPSPNMSRAASLMSLKLFRAQLALRLKHVQDD